MEKGNGCQLLMLADRERIPLLVASTKLEKGLRAMTMKEKLEMHKRIEAENQRKLNEWLAKQKKSA